MNPNKDLFPILVHNNLCEEYELAWIEVLTFSTIICNLIALKEMRTTRNLKRWMKRENIYTRNRPQLHVQMKTHKWTLKEMKQIPIYHRTGVLEQTFVRMYNNIKRDMLKLKKQSLPAPVSLLITLHYLRHYPKILMLSDIYHTHPSTIWRTIKRTCGILATMESIRWPLNFETNLDRLVGAIDCSSHPRSRVHPEQYYWYRADKGYHFMTSQLVVSLDGQILDVALGKGHNNDQGMYKLTKMNEFLTLQDYQLVADGGYSASALITPDEEMGKAWNYNQKLLRLIVEYVLMFTKCFEFARAKVRVSPEIQTLGLLATFQIAAEDLKSCPLTAPSNKILTNNYRVIWETPQKKS